MERGAGGNSRLARAGASIRRHWIAIRSSLLFVALLGLWLIWYPNIVASQVLDGFLESTAQITGFILRILGAPVVVTDIMVSSPDFSMRIGHECTAIIPMVILLCAVLAYPSRISHKLVGLAIGLPVLFLLNLVRTVTLYYIGANIPDFFETAHFVVWQSAMILAMVALWLFWVGKVVNVRPA